MSVEHSIGHMLEFEDLVHLTITLLGHFEFDWSKEVGRAAYLRAI